MIKNKIIYGVIIILVVIIWIAAVVSGNVLSFSPFLLGSIFPFVMAVLMYCEELKKGAWKRRITGRKKSHKTKEIG